MSEDLLFVNGVPSNGGVVPAYVSSQIASVLIDEKTIADRISMIAEEITQDYAGKNPIMLGILTGSFVFLADLSRKMQCQHEICFARASSYVGQDSSGIVTLSGIDDIAVEGRHIIIVEDIVDTGLTLEKILATLNEKSVASVTICSFLVKMTERRSKFLSLPVKYTAFEIPDVFVVGYGLDYNQQLRHLPFVGIYKQ